MNTHIDSHIAHTVFCGLLATVLGLFFSFGFSIEKAHAGYAADYQGLPWYCAELDDGLLANVTCQEAGVSNSLGSPAPRQCEASDVDSDSGSNCARLDGDGFNIYGVLSVHEVDTPQNGVTQYLRGTSESDRHGIMFVGPTLRTVGSDTTSNLKGHHIDEEYVSVTGGRDQWAWVWYTQNEYTPPDWLEDMGRQCKNWGCWRRPYELFSYVYDNQLLDKNSNEFYKRRWQDHDEGVSIEDDWDMSVFSIADTYVQGANNTADAVLQVAPNQEVEIDWMCQDEQTSQFGDQRGLFGLWDQRGYHKVKFFDAANTTNLGGTTEKSGVFRLTPTEDTVYTIQCKSSADEVEYDVYIEGKRTCSPTGECTSRRLNREVTHTYPEKLGEVLSVFVDVIDPDDPDDPAIVTSISADPTEITLGIGDQTATITWQTDWVYAEPPAAVPYATGYMQRR